MDGLLLIDKPEGMTSAHVVRIVKQRLGCKTGHLGTLDPFASGVLPLCLGEGTKIAQFLNVADKEYVGVIRLGSATATGDPTGAVTATAAVPVLDVVRLPELAARFLGDSLQVPPMYSAIKQRGTPLYKLARQGLAVDRQPRPVRIDRLQLERGGDAALNFSVRCSKGTYIRVLAEEIAAALGTVGHLETLRRTRFGSFDLQDALPLDALGEGPVPVIGLRQALHGLREIVVTAAVALRAWQGYEPVLASLPPGRADELAKLVDAAGNLVAVMVADAAGRWRFSRVFSSPAGCSA